MDTYRLFIAAPLPATVKAALVVAQQRFRRGGAPIKWAAPETMHLTLRFLGETAPNLLPALSAAIGQACAAFRAFRLSLTQIGAFPNLRQPTVVWAGVGGDTTTLTQLAAALDPSLAALGFTSERRPFRPHLTLGRARREATPTAIERLGDLLRALPQLPPIEWEIHEIMLFRSELRPAGAIYSAIAAYRLQDE
ncbi:MAG: RNA 2',3'-cyclic phosphodiesterase [Kouleothrix sp.]|jgi:2'-5' RNA ligase|nr:RNA 2',3'-cyclic phosphodiesterase [Kouleothrix sp.]